MSRVPTLEDWSLYDEHLDEAAFCWRQWQTAIAAPHYSLTEVEAGPEERLFGHVDALVIGGRAVAERMLLPALEGPDAHAASAATLALLAAEDGDYLEPILTQLRSEHENVPAIGRALARDRRADHAAALARVWGEAEPRLRVWLIEPLAAAMPRAWLPSQLASCVSCGDPALAELALRCVWRAPDPGYEALVRAQLAAAVPSVKAAAIVAALVLGMHDGWQACRAAAQADRGLLAVSCAAGSSELLRAVYARFDAGEHSADMLWALGFAGTREAAERLVSRLDAPVAATGAADSLAAISGLRIEAGLMERAEPKPDPLLEDPPPLVEAEDFLAKPNTGALRRAWHELQPRFANNVRYALGLPAEPAGLRNALEHGASWRREVYAIALALSRKTGTPIALHDWAREQRLQLRAAVR